MKDTKLINSFRTSSGFPLTVSLLRQGHILLRLRVGNLSILKSVDLAELAEDVV